MGHSLTIGIFSLIPWSFIHQRPHKFAEELAAVGHTVYYVEPPDLTGDRLAKLGRALQLRPAIRAVAPGIRALRPLVVPPFRAYAHLLPHNRWLQPMAVRLLRQLKLDFAIVLATEYGPVVRALGIPFAYDHVDDTQFMEHVLTEQFVTDMEALKESSAFNIYIQEREAERDSKGFFIPNGVDVGQFFPLPAEKIFDAVVLSNIAKWFDMDAILGSEKTILLIGPMDIDGGNNRARFLAAQRPNLLWIPEVDKELANMWLSRAKVGLVPFSASHPVVRYAMPIKILEYFLADLPVVTYRNEGIQRMYGDMVTFYSATGADPPLDEAIEIAQTKAGLGYPELAARYQWQSIVARLEERIAQELGVPPAPRRIAAVTSPSIAAPKLVRWEALADRAEESTPAGAIPKLGIAYLGASDWEYIKQRPQHMAMELSRCHEVSYVRPVPLSRALHHPTSRLLPPKMERISPSLAVVRPRALSPGRVGIVARVNDALAGKDIREAFPNGRLDVLWLSHPAQATFAGRLGERLVVYDVMDNHVSFCEPNRRASVDALEVGLLEKADVVFVSSEGLKRRAAQYAKGIVALVANGVDWHHFVRAATEALPRPVDLPGGQRFRVGFYGTLGPWVDTALMRSVAEAHPDWAIVLIGPAGGADLGVLDGMANVHVLGPKPYDDLPRYLQHVHVWTLPFGASPLTADVDPVKVYEYLAAGKPVVAIDLPELAKFGDLIRAVADRAGFASALESARDEVCSEEHREQMARRIEYVREHTWAQRAALASRIMTQALALRASHPPA